MGPWYVFFVGLALADIVTVPTHRVRSIRNHNSNVHGRTKRSTIQLVGDYYDDFYVVPIAIGHPPQQFNVLLDTGSANLWVIDSHCESAACNGSASSGYAKRRFNSTGSGTLVNLPQQISLTYEFGYCNGHLADDMVQISNMSFPQRFTIATFVDDNFGEKPIDGILGLGWPNISVESIPTPLQNMASLLPEAMFTIWLDRRLELSEGGAGGQVTYGGYDTEHCAGNASYVPLSSTTYWQITLTSFAVGGYNSTIVEEAAVDTGSSFIMAPNYAVIAIRNSTNATYNIDSGLFTVPCTVPGPDLSFRIGGIDYFVPSIEYIVDLQLGGNQCVLAVENSAIIDYGPAWILGAPFMRTYCCVHDIGNRRIGFAPAKHSEI